jgi:uracil-DNA glycosylase family 4
MKYQLPTLLKEIKNCKTCAEHLSHGANPVLTAAKKSKIIVIGQAPGMRVHLSGQPWADKSGEKLISWLGIDRETFYDTSKFAIIPMGFCYPGKNPKGGDLPPRKECAPQWHPPLFDQMKNVKLKLLIGSYAQKYYLKKEMKKNLTETVRTFEDYLPEYFPIVHPSPLNFRWMRNNPWFDKDVLPVLKKRIKEIL